jgi:hypothetical protein
VVVELERVRDLMSSIPPFASISKKKKKRRELHRDANVPLYNQSNWSFCVSSKRCNSLVTLFNYTTTTTPKLPTTYPLWLD